MTSNVAVKSDFGWLLWKPAERDESQCSRFQRLGNKGWCEADGDCCFPYVYHHFPSQTEGRLKKAREPGPPACRQSKSWGWGVKREQEIRERKRENGKWTDKRKRDKRGERESKRVRDISRKRHIKIEIYIYIYRERERQREREQEKERRRECLG